MTIGQDGYLTRKEAARFLTSECRFPISVSHLANLASNNNAGGGPPFYRFGWRSVRYVEAELRAWAAGQITRVA